MAGPMPAGMQNIDIGLVRMVNCPVCPVTDGTESKMRPGRDQRSVAGPHFRPIGSAFSEPRRVLGQTSLNFISTKK